VDRNKGRRLQLHRVSAYAIITHKASTRAQFDEDCGFHDPRQEEALNRQPEEGDDEEEVEVLYHLKQLAETTLASRKPGVRSQSTRFSNSGTTTLVANVQSLSFTSLTQERVPPSSFRRYSVRRILDCSDNRHGIRYGGHTTLKGVIPNFPYNSIESFFSRSGRRFPPLRQAAQLRRHSPDLVQAPDISRTECGGEAVQSSSKNKEDEIYATEFAVHVHFV
jgi:hypothetical protein